jgi:hypothetical protein
MGGKPFTDLSDALSFIEWAKNQPADIKDLYFCLSLQAKTALGRNGEPTALRRAANAVALKAIWLDIDCNKVPPKGYPTKEDGVKALNEFCDTTHTPYPTAIIDSGNGLHAYWISDRPLSAKEWSGYAEGLHALTTQHGLIHDPITTDAARVLRVAGTSNNKQVPAKPVKILLLEADLSFASALGHLLKANAGEPAAADGRRRAACKGVADIIPPDGFNQNEHDFSPLPFQPIQEGCSFFADAYETHGKDHSQPLWNLVILATTFLESGEQLAHALGSGHPGYTLDTTQAMWDRKVHERKELGLGWPGCQAFENAGCTFCETCQHHGKIQSPLHLALGQKVAPEEPFFVDPYADFAGPPFPVDVLPPTLAKFVDAEERCMGADPSAIAMAVLTAVAGAIRADTLIKAGEGRGGRVCRPRLGRSFRACGSILPTAASGRRRGPRRMPS